MPTTTLQSLGYLPVATASLYPAAVLDCDLFVQRPGRSFAELYRGRSYPLETTDIDRLRQDGVDNLYIRVSDADDYRAYLCEHVLKQPGIPLVAKVKALREVTRATFQDALTANDCNRMVGVAGGFGRDLANMIAEHSPVFDELFLTLEHDSCTFTHVCNVSLYGAILGSRLGGFDAAGLAELAMGGLLHDIGKRRIPLCVLNKPGSLTDEEWELVREHPAIGFRDLAQRKDVTWAQLMMVYQHHERLDGSGYPAGIVADEMHPWAKLCAVVDVFDALTCQRPYRRPLPVAEACEHLTKRAGTLFDAEMVACWTSHMGSL
jgi:HD-GYP domain-containing protein (c-di-GMP phosphodiesterase class II)